MRTLGIDPGTESFDLCGLEDGRVFQEKVLESSKLAKDPDILIEAIEEATPLDLIAGPSGYGVEPTRLKDLELKNLEDWYLTYILLLKKADFKSALDEGNPGIMVYSAMVKSALEMKRRNLPVCYIPGVINLPTVPRHRKFNNLDMGTVDKLGCAVLGIHDQKRRLNIPVSETSFILLEMGAGYNAAIGVENGKVVDGIGGTMTGMGFLCSGSLDLEMVQLASQWEKADIFTGGVSVVADESSPEKVIENRKEENFDEAWNRMMEDLEKSIASLTASVPEPKEILISGRMTEFPEGRGELSERVEKYAPVQKIRPLEKADKVKEAAQGYAMTADGLKGGRFGKIIDQLEIENAKGTALDYIRHPKGRKAAEKIREKTPF